MGDIFNYYREQLEKVHFKADRFEKAQQTLGSDSLEAQEDAGLIRETTRAKVFSISTKNDFVTVDFLKELPGQETKDRVEARLLAADILKDRNIFGVSKIIAADTEKGFIVREDELGKELSGLGEEFDHHWDEEEFLSLMLTLDEMIKLDILPAMDSESINHAFEEQQGSSIGFIVNDYHYSKGLNDSLTQIERRESIVASLRDTVLQAMKKSFPEEAENIENNFRVLAKMFLDTSYLKHEENFEQEAQAFEPHLSNIAKKIDHNNSSGSPRYLEDLSPQEKKQIIGYGGECLVIKGDDPSKVAKIYYKGNASAVQEIKSLDRAHTTGTHDVAIPLAFKGNIVIEEKLPGKNLKDLAEGESFSDPKFIERFKLFLPRFFKTFEDLYQVGIFPDPGLANLLFDEERGFSMPDLRLEELHNLKEGVQGISREIEDFSTNGEEILGEDLNKIYQGIFNEYLENKFQAEHNPQDRIRKSK